MNPIEKGGEVSSSLEGQRASLTLIVAVAVEDLVASAEDSARRKTSVDQWNRLESSSGTKNTTVL